MKIDLNSIKLELPKELFKEFEDDLVKRITEEIQKEEFIKGVVDDIRSDFKNEILRTIDIEAIAENITDNIDLERMSKVLEKHFLNELINQLQK